MPKRFPSPPKPDDDDIHPPGADSDVWPQIGDLAWENAEDNLAELLAREGLGGRPVAKLLIMAVHAMAKYKPMAADADRLNAEAEKADRAKNAARSFRPVTLAETIEQGEAIHQATCDWGRLTNLAGEAWWAGSYCAFLRQQFPELFGVQPEGYPDGEGVFRPRVLGSCPPELQVWFAARLLDTRVYGCWRTIGTETPERPKRRKIVAIAPVNARRS